MLLEAAAACSHCPLGAAGSTAYLAAKPLVSAARPEPLRIAWPIRCGLGSSRSVRPWPIPPSAWLLNQSASDQVGPW